MKSKALATTEPKQLLVALVATLLMVLGLGAAPAEAASYKCKAGSGQIALCGNFVAADISSEGKFVYAIEDYRSLPTATLNRYKDQDYEHIYRVIRIDAASGRSKVVLDWQFPKVKIADMKKGERRTEAIARDLDLSPDGKKILLFLEMNRGVLFDLFGEGDYTYFELWSEQIRTDISVVDVATSKVQDLSASLGLTDSKKYYYGIVDESVYSAYWSANSREVFVNVFKIEGSTRGETQQGKVNLARPTMLVGVETMTDEYGWEIWPAGHNSVSAGSKFAIQSEYEGNARLINLRTNKLAGEIKNSGSFDVWNVEQVLPKDTGRAFLLRANEYDFGDGVKNGALFSLDNRGNRKLVFSSKDHIHGLKYAERGKKALLKLEDGKLLIVRA